MEDQGKLRYRMPVVFGPSPGPRQSPDGAPFDYSGARASRANVTFLTDEGALTRLLPRGFRLAGDPVATVDVYCMRNLPWLAGRGYNSIGFNIPAVFEGERDKATGPFVAVLWESMPEPIITGREELGFAKLYCEIPEPRVAGGVHDYSGVWDGHEFFQMRLSELKETPLPSPASTVDGLLHYRYMPSVTPGAPPDVEQVVLLPTGGGGGARIAKFCVADGSVSFRHCTWQQAPTMSHIINALADLPVLEQRAATYVEVEGGADGSNLRVLV